MRTTSHTRPRRSITADDRGGGVDVALAQAVGRRRGEGVVVVVPGLAEGGHGEPEQVARVVVGGVALLAEEVAERVDAVGHVVNHQHAHAAAPEQAGEGGRERAADGVAERERERQPDEHPEQEGLVHPADHRVLLEVRRVAGLGTAVGVDEEPAHVCVKEARERAAHPALVAHVRAVGVALLVGEGVVLAVVGHPGGHRPLDRHRAHDREPAVHPGLGLEGPVREVAVEAHGHAQAGDQVHDQEHRYVAPVEEVVPDLPADDAERDERHDGDRAGGDPVNRLVGDRLDVVHAGRLGGGRDWGCLGLAHRG